MPDNQRTIIETHALTIGYKSTRGQPRVVAENINVSLLPGELVCLIGPNGAGKSTLMRTIAGMQPPLSGIVLLMGDNVALLPPSDLAKRLAIVLTERVEIGMLSAYGLVGLGRHPYTDWSGRLSAYDEDMIRWALESVGAVDLAHRNVHELSDGERQKVMIARALAQEPALILLDEPTAFLDLPRRVEILQVLRGLARSSGRAILLSTHDLDLALRSADRIWLLPKEDALQVGAPEDLILSGAFESVFRSEGVEFDPQTGSFRLNTRLQRQVILKGTGMAALWTARAMERAGIAIVSAGIGAPFVEIIGEAHPQIWKLTYATESQDYTSLYALINALKTD